MAKKNTTEKEDLFRVVEKGSGKILAKDLTFEQAFQYRLDNIDKSTTFDVKVQDDAKSSKKEEIDEEKLKEEFIKNLNPQQYGDLSNGFKELVFKNGKWGLKTVKGAERQEIHISVQHTKQIRETEVINKLKNILKLEEIKYDIMDKFMEMYTSENVDSFDVAWSRLMKA